MGIYSIISLKEEMKNMYHICLLTSGRIFEALYGESRFTLNLGKWLVKNNQNVILMGSGFTGIKTKQLSKFQSEQQTIKNKKNPRVIYPPYIIYMFSRLLFSFLWLIKILSLNKNKSIKLIHAQDTGYSGLAAVFAGKILGIPVVISSHGIRHKTLEKKYTGKLSKILLKFEHNLDIFTIKKCTSLIAINPIIKKYYEKIVSKKIEIIPIPINSQNFVFSDTNREKIRKELGVDQRAIVIGYVGRFVPDKNILALLHAFARAEKTNSLLKLVLVGSGIQESKLKEEVSNKGIQDRVIFCGVRNDVGQILSCFDIFVLPSYVEGLSTALLEAMTAGRAIICSNIPANLELVKDKHEGLLVNPNNPEELKEAIQLLSNNESLRIKLGNNAKKRASQYDEDLIFPKILEQYNSLVKSN